MNVIRMPAIGLVTAGVLAFNAGALAQEGGTTPEIDTVTKTSMEAAEVAQEPEVQGTPDNPKTLADLTMESSTETRQVICAMVQEAADQLTERIPIAIDEVTMMVNADTVFLNGVCTYNLQYEVSEAKLLDRLQVILSEARGEDLPLDFVRNFYATGGVGYSMMKQGLRNTLLSDSQFASVANIPFVEVRANFVMHGDSMQDFELLIGRHNN